MDARRFLRHLVAGLRGGHPLFDAQTLARLQQAIAAGEAGHRAELRLIVETALPLRKVRRGVQTRQRALDLFGTFRVWDTEDNNGVLLYINAADRKLEVVADRAAARRVDDAVWKRICDDAAASFRRGAFEEGASGALAAIHGVLATAFPADGTTARRNELPDAPVVL